jgi:hypothetical protein
MRAALALALALGAGALPTSAQPLAPPSAQPLAPLHAQPLAPLSAQPLVQPRAEAPSPPESPPGVVLLERAEAPWLVAALALPSAALPARAELLAAWLEVEESWPAGAIAELYARGGRLEVRATPEGLLLVAEGAARDHAAILAAALALHAGERPSPAGLPMAQARALARLAFVHEDARAQRQRALWRSFYGEGGRGAALPEDFELIRARPGPLQEALEAFLAASAGQALVLEGRLPPGPWPEAVALLRWASAGERLSPSWPAPAPPAEPAAASLTAAWPIPPGGALGTSSQLAFEALLEEALRALGAPATVSVQAGAHHALVFLEVQPGGPTRAALAAALTSARSALPPARALEAALARAQARQDAAYGPVGAQARAEAARRLLGLEPPPSDARAATARLLRLMVLPEVLRGAPPPAAPPAPQAPPALQAPPPAAPPALHAPPPAAPPAAAAAARG